MVLEFIERTNEIEVWRYGPYEVMRVACTVPPIRCCGFYGLPSVVGVKCKRKAILNSKPLFSIRSNFVLCLNSGKFLFKTKFWYDRYEIIVDLIGLNIFCRLLYLHFLFGNIVIKSNNIERNKISIII